MPEGSRIKLSILFIIFGFLIYSLSLTRWFYAVAATIIFLGIVCALLTVRDFDRSLRARGDEAASDDKEEAPSPRASFNRDVMEREIYEMRKEDGEERIKFISGVYDRMAEDAKRDKKKIQEQNEQLDKQKTWLEQEKSKIEVILKSVPDGMTTIDLQRKIISWNPGAETITEWEKSKVLDAKWSKALKLFDKAGKPLSEEESPIEECFRTGQVLDKSNIFLKTRYGKDKPIDIVAAPIFDEKNGVLSVVAAFRDISKKWEIEKLKEDFLAMVTHDLKSPLAAIVGYTNLLLHPRAQFDAEQQKSFLTSILGSVKILQFLIDNILESARLESGRIVYQFEDFDLHALMLEIQIMFTPLVNSKKVALELKGEPLWVQGDREKIREVINNLVSNAIKFTPEGGIISLMYKKRGDKAEIKVRDTGKGIPSGEIDKLFKKFVQVKGEKRGTGLGLYISKRILEDHEQTIRVESEQGKGTEFTFTLKEGAPRDQKASRASKPSRRKKGKVLIVEDNPEVSNLIKYYLKEAGYESAQAFQGNDVPAMIDREKPDLITLDYNLPDINGEEVIKRLNKTGKKVRIPIIIVTANAKKNWDIPYECIFNKPLDEERFIEEVENILQKKQPLIESVEVLH